MLAPQSNINGLLVVVLNLYISLSKIPRYWAKKEAESIIFNLWENSVVKHGSYRGIFEIIECACFVEEMENFDIIFLNLLLSMMNDSFTVEWYVDQSDIVSLIFQIPFLGDRKF